MVKYDLYLNCKEHVKVVKEFLSLFFEEEVGRYNHENWVTFKIPKTDFKVNLMRGKDQSLTQNVTFEIECSSKSQLEKFAKKYNCKIHDFIVTETKQRYRYYYIEIFGPEYICKLEINYSEDEE